MQTQKPKAKAQKFRNLEIEQKFEGVKQLSTTRLVKLKYQSGCGCGSKIHTIEREVPIDSPLKNGDHIYYLHPEDKYIK